MSLARRLIVGGSASFDAPTPDGTLTVGAISTVTNDTKYNAWPQVVRMTNGSLLTAYSKANDHNGDNSGIQVCKTSTDDGATWSAEVTIADETLGAISTSLVALSTGRVVCAYSLFNVSGGAPVDAVRVRYSDDFGASWSSAYTVNTAYTSTVTNGNGRMIELANGTVMLAVYGLDTSETNYSASVVFSSDHGATWGGEVTVTDGHALGQQQYEPSLTRLLSGDVLCHIRTSAGTGNIYQSRSTNSGASWGASAAAFGGYSPANAIQLESGTLIATIRGNAAAALEAFTSLNDGVTWTSQGILDSGFTELEYACPVQLADGRVLIVYSVQPTSSISNADIKQVYVTEDRS